MPSFTDSCLHLTIEDPSLPYPCLPSPRCVMGVLRICHNAQYSLCSMTLLQPLLVKTPLSLPHPSSGFT